MTMAIRTSATSGLGCVGIVDDAGKLAGIITDGDLRRHLSGPDLLNARIADVMTPIAEDGAARSLVGAALDF